MGQRGLLVSELISYSLAWPERWPGEGDEPLLAQHLGNLVAISFCLFFSWRIATPLCLSSRPVAGWAACRCAQSHRAMKPPPCSPCSAQSYAAFHPCLEASTLWSGRGQEARWILPGRRRPSWWPQQPPAAAGQSKKKTARGPARSRTAKCWC